MRRIIVGLAALTAAAILVVWVLRRSHERDGREQPGAGSAAASAAHLRGRTAEPATGFTGERLDLEDDPAGDQRLEGQVIDDQEQPVAGARVVLDALPPRETTTEADGGFFFDGLIARSYRLEARSGDLAAGPVSTRLAPGSEPIIMRLRPASRLEVQVVDGKDAPIAGALVEVRHVGAMQQTTDAAGIAVLRGLNAGTHVLKVAAAGYASSLEAVAVSGAPGAVAHRRVQLREGVAVAGTVVDPAGRPVEGARVTVESTNSYWDLSDQRLDAVVTDPRGRWEHTGLARQTFRFRAFHPELAPGLSEPVSLADGAGRDDVVIRLELGGRISGRVVDAAGAPVPGARVQAASSDLRSGPVRRAHADADGRFLLSGLPRAEVSLIAADRDASSAMLSLDLSERHQRDGVELRLALDGVIAGTVVTSKGDEVGEARVIATPFLDDSFGESLEQRLRGQTSDVADQAGHFRLTGLAPGRYRVRAIRPGSSAELLQMKPGATADVGTAGVKVVVDDLTSMSGQVRFRSGGIPKLFSVRLGASAARSFAGADGRFRLDEVPAGKQFVTISGPELVMVHRADVTLTAGEDNDLGMIDVDRGRTVRGRVTSGGAPVAGAQVVLGAEILGDGWSVMPFKDRAERLGVKQAVTDADGSYTMTGIGPLDQEVIAERDGVGRSVATEVPPGTADLTINLAVEPFGSLSGHLRLNGKPTSGLIFMRPTTAANMNFMVNSGSDGAYHFDRLGPGSYVAFGVLETHGGSGGGEGGTGRTIAIRSGATATADFDINKGTLEVTVRLTSAGDVVQFGYAVLCKLPPGPVPHMPATIGDARRFLTEMVGGDIYEGFMVKDRQRVFTEIAPGSYGACVAPLTGPPDDPDVIARMQADVIHTPIYCKTFTVTDGPPQQGVTVEVQPAP